MKRLIIILMVLCCQKVAFGQGWQRILTDSLQVENTCNTYDGGYLIAGVDRKINNQPFYKLIKIDSNGVRQWIRPFPDLKAITTGLYASTYPHVSIIKSPDSLFLWYSVNDSIDGFALKKLDKEGNTLWTKKILLDYPILKSSKTDYIIVGKSRSSSDIILLKLNLNGDTISQKVLNLDIPTDFNIHNDGYLFLAKNSGKLFKTDFEGRIVWIIDLPIGFKSKNDIFFNKLFTSRDTNYYIYGDIFNFKWLKLSRNGDSIWFKNTPNPEEQNTVGLMYDGGLLNSTFNTNSPNIVRLSSFNKNGYKIWSKQYFQNKNLYIKSIIKCIDGGYLVVGAFNTFELYGYGSVFLLKIDENGDVFSNNLEGSVKINFDKNCQINSTDKPFKSCIIEAKKNNGEVFWGISDSLGRYFINIDSGNYTIKAYPQYSRNYWQLCTPSVSKTFSSAKYTDSLDFLISPIIDCPAMLVDISTPFLRRCFNNTYTVYYCNKGSLKADNAYVTVTLDSLLEFVSASKSIFSKAGRTYRFDVGNMAVDDCGSFNITTKVRCGDSTRLGQTLCVEAKIYPDTVCSPVTLWSGANMVVTGSCQTDSVLFQIKNTGRAASSNLKSIVIEDEVLFLREPVQLPQNGVFSKKFPANGRTWRMTVEQEPNHPTSTNPTAFVEGCRTASNLPFSTGFATRFPNDDKALNIDVDCQQIQGAFDPNDKTGFPTGYKNERFIAQNQDIEYLIRFQNTGTDTAFTVVIRDTISEKLDISSIEFGASSHAYEPEIYGKGILKFTFNNILLVDSFKNEPKSHGFVKYRIKQQKDLAFGTKIYNSAGIYFDFNQPIITNKTLHTVGGKDIISATIEKNFAPNFPIKISPNPFSEKAIFEMPSAISGDFELLDIMGKILRKERIEGTTFEFQRNDLAAGIYLFKISTDGRSLSIGKLVVQ